MLELEAWEKVYIAGINNNPAPFLGSVHGPNYEGTVIEHALTCQMCHNGPADNTFSDMTEAHVGVISDPSDATLGQPGCLQCHDEEFGQTACDHCHQTIAESNANSLHTNLWGEKRAIELRGQCTFEGAPWTDMYENKCGGCHTSCGQCHISRPTSVGGGFPRFNGIIYSAHRFNRTPDMTENCTACHGSRVGTDFQGQLEGNLPDVHLDDHGMRCIACHEGTEMHGDGQHSGDHYEHRYEVASMPRCEDCHGALEANEWHNAHVGVSGRNLQCQVCHSQPYKNCTNCHNLVADEEPNKYDITPSVVQFKIAHNPSDHRSEYDFVTVRHVPVDPGTYDDWGLNLPGYLDVPTWKYTSAHNILRNTPQTTVEEGQACGTACHGTPDSPQGWFLRESDLYDGNGQPLPDYNANIDIVITDEAVEAMKTAK